MNSNSSTTSATWSVGTQLLREKAPLILEAIQKSSNILLHCHPSPDPDSVGSALAMKFALEQMGKKATVIKGDSDIPQGFMHFPGADTIVQQNFLETDLLKFDLFLALDTAAVDRISSLAGSSLTFPPTLTVVVIDHHRTNPGYGSINLVDASYPATAQMLFDLFVEWNINFTPEIASNLLMGIYTDTGGFKYKATTPQTFFAAAELLIHAPNFSDVVSKMENSSTIHDLHYQGLALSSVEAVCGGKVGIATVSYDSLIAKGISVEHVTAGFISSIMRSVSDFVIVGAVIETAPGTVKLSFRSKDADLYDVAKLAEALGGGGHKAAAGGKLEMSLPAATEKVVATIKEMYNL